MFFTPVRELGMALHEMWEVSNLPMGPLPHEEYFPCNKELKQLEEETTLYETYRELMCHFSFVSTLIQSRKHQQFENLDEISVPSLDGAHE